MSDSALEIDISPRNGYHNGTEQSSSALEEPDQADLVRHLKEQVSA